ncbi:septum site-determining protein MinC [Peribacillus cavernae]|uniref:Probable septum site-determining protein MinC n=1 Tax=Peribacillus cavernae TaxID=1674310 RepID=A0A3S0VWQ5_9BACI|nr:septum site-determining protein MinC [Peribacillus cavernae]MDQ0219369.1 septum site-determining protein MinC [Peribacillus cavernae]RUQ27754.1 septum site-determining protein MinC [Peribacillus cavernae]
MNKRTQQNVMIKGTKDGLTLHLDDSCSFFELLKELETKLSANYQFQENDSLIAVKVHTGNRYLSADQKEKIKELIRKKKKLVVDDIHSNVVTLDEARQWKEENEITTVAKMVRSGQIIKVPGDLLLIGDVNPGGTVTAGGNIYVMGVLKGIAHAGFSGNEGAIIAASVMKPAHLRISDIVNRTPDGYTEDGHGMECAYIDENHQLVIGKLQVLKTHRPNLNRLEGRL